MERSVGFSLPKEKRSSEAHVDRACLGVLVILLVPLAMGDVSGLPGTRISLLLN